MSYPSVITSILCMLVSASCAVADPHSTARTRLRPVDDVAPSSDAAALPSTPEPNGGPSDASDSPDSDCQQRGALFSEIHYDPDGPDGDGAAEFLELVAEPGRDLSGLEIRLINGSDGTLIRRLPVALPEVDRMPRIIGGSQTNAAQSLAGPLQNGPDSAELWDPCRSERLDVAVWPLADSSAPAGASIQRCPDGSWTYGDPSPRLPTRLDLCQPQTPDPATDAGTPDAGLPSDAGDGDDVERSIDGISQPDVPDAADTTAVSDDQTNDAHQQHDGDDLRSDDLECPASPPVLVFSELLFDPPGADSPTNEFVEVRTDARVGEFVALELTQIDGARGEVVWSRSWHTRVLDGGLILIGASSDPDLALPPAGLQNGPDRLELRDCNGELVDAWDYGPWDPAGPDAVGDAPQGASLAVCHAMSPGAAIGEPPATAGPTPGRTNRGFMDPTFCAPPCVPGNPADVRLAAVLFNPDGTDGGHEYLVLQGRRGAVMDRMVVRMVDGSSSNPAWSMVVSGRLNDVDGTFIVAGDRVLPRDADLAGALQNGPDWVALEDCSGRQLDTIAWGSGPMSAPGPVAQAGSGCALYRSTSTAPWQSCCDLRLEPLACRADTAD